MTLFGGAITISGITFMLLTVLVVIVAGYIIGRISIKEVSIGTAGVFVAALIFGALFNDTIHNALTLDGGDLTNTAFSLVENAGLVLFVGSVGMMAGPGFFRNLKKNYKSYILIGIIIIAVGSLTTISCYYIAMGTIDLPSDAAKLGITKSDYAISMMTGIMSGSLTSTPAFSAAQSTAADIVPAGAAATIQDVITIGHAIAYIFGVIGVVLFVQLIPRMLNADMEKERELIKISDEGESAAANEPATTDNGKVAAANEPAATDNSKVAAANEPMATDNGKGAVANESAITVASENGEFEKREKETKRRIKIDVAGYAAFGIVAIIGIIIGMIKIPLSSDGFSGSTFSLTTTGGVLISSLVLSYIGHIGPLSIQTHPGVLKGFRELGLAIFLVGAGIPGGASFVKYYQSIYFLYGVIITIIPMIIGYFIAYKVFKLPLLNSLGSITGGMTSTPALGCLIKTAGTDDVASSYASVYPVALVCVVLSSQFMILLFG